MKISFEGFELPIFIFRHAQALHKLVLGLIFSRLRQSWNCCWTNRVNVCLENGSEALNFRRDYSQERCQGKPVATGAIQVQSDVRKFSDDVD